MPLVSEASPRGPLLLEGKDLQTVREILARVIPQHAVWAFGSRAHGRYVWRFSDLDLAVGGQLTCRERAALKNAFEESLLPMLVDVVEMGSVDAEFADRIRPDLVPVQGSVAQAAGA